MNIKNNINVLKEYELNSKHNNRVVGVAIMEDNNDIEYHFLPDLSIIKIMIPNKKILFELPIPVNIEGDSSYEHIQKTMELIIESNLSEFSDSALSEERFIHVPKKFLFNEQETTDNVVITQNDEDELGFILIDRQFPPTGFAMAGGMVEEDETSTINSEKELKEELGEEMKTRKLKEYNGKISTYEVRGSLNTLLTVYYSPDGYRESPRLNSSSYRQGF